ncbi:Os03g0359100 [Oryza sativa Japonica Group]|uniref:Os03g0359100 protein n=2 Tax=Oryza sativa subsp. japonica TaxID=39947 RepID=C7IZX5_ORYSJ|nr:hypothetical protein EE612_017516 [Oryza sativa]BAH92157.1 Os03g0359100 [Oryza sativa Japonica Group]BAS84272.1 Os03g0359100 [Oryza sativa Japonica Group]|eukprot:NP_001173429.1 Os03g0359100 [Oryza sativa Japonica Group]
MPPPPPEPEPEPVVIHAWSAPRSLSTSLMYSFAQRDDMEVLDEPLYANFLRVTGVDRPYREELLSNMCRILMVTKLSVKSFLGQGRENIVTASTLQSSASLTCQVT